MLPLFLMRIMTELNSKQIHKIPGTIYAQSFAHSPSTSMNSFESWDSKREETDSFKRRMESLHDPTSTNLYMEGYVRLILPTFISLISFPQFAPQH